MPSIIDVVLVVGHHDPDTDAVCSALAYAAFYAWQTGEETVACHLDELNRETAWLLSHLGLPAPRAFAFLRFWAVWPLSGCSTWR